MGAYPRVARGLVTKSTPSGGTVGPPYFTSVSLMASGVS